MYLIVALLGIWVVVREFTDKPILGAGVKKMGLPDLPSLSDIADAVKEAIFGGDPKKKAGYYDVKPTQPGTKEHEQDTPAGTFDPNKPQAGT